MHIRIIDDVEEFMYDYNDDLAIRKAMKNTNKTLRIYSNHKRLITRHHETSRDITRRQ